MNTMEASLREAGLKLPTAKERIWRIVKEAGWVDAYAVAKRMDGIPFGTICSSLSDMEQRGMVMSRGAKGSGPSGKRKEYSTDLEAYQVLAKIEPPASAPPKPKQEVCEQRRLPVAEETWPPAPGMDASRTADLIRNLTLTDIVRLHRELDRLIKAAPWILQTVR